MCTTVALWTIDQKSIEHHGIRNGVASLTSGRLPVVEGARLKIESGRAHKLIPNPRSISNARLNPMRGPAVERLNATTVAMRLSALAKADTKQLARDLLEAVQGIDPKRFGMLVGELPEEENAAIRRVLAPGSIRIPAVPAGAIVWNHGLD